MGYFAYWNFQPLVHNALDPFHVLLVLRAWVKHPDLDKSNVQPCKATDRLRAHSPYGFKGEPFYSAWSSIPPGSTSAGWDTVESFDRPQEQQFSIVAVFHFRSLAYLEY